MIAPSIVFPTSSRERMCLDSKSTISVSVKWLAMEHFKVDLFLGTFSILLMISYAYYSFRVSLDLITSLTSN